MELIIALTVTVAVASLMLSFFSKPTSNVSARLEAFKAYAPTFADDAVEQPPNFIERVVRPLARACLRLLRVVLPADALERLDFRLTQAGNPMTLPTMLIVWAGVGIGIPALLFLVVSSGGPIGGQQLGLLAFSAVLSMYLPHALLRSKIRSRQQRILKSMPDAIDLLSTCVEAGLGIDASLGQVAEKVPGPISVEIRRVLREMSRGATRREALQAFSERVDLPDVKQFVNAILQAEQMGVPLASVIRVQSDQMRVKRRQRAEAKAMQAPVKMVFPLVLFIFPSMFIVILGPAGIQIMKTLGGE